MKEFSKCLSYTAMLVATIAAASCSDDKPDPNPNPGTKDDVADSIMPVVNSAHRL